MSDRSIHLRAFAVPDALGAAGRGWGVFVRMLRARQTRRLLAEMDDRMLADIGISRGDAQTEAGRPMWDFGPR